MRVLHVYKTYWPDTFGGVERVINSIAIGCSGLGITSDVLSLSADPVTNTVRFNDQLARKAKLDLEIASTGLSRQLFVEFDRIAQDYDLIHYQFPWPFMDLLHLKSRVRKPSVVSYQSDIVKQKTLGSLYRPLMHRYLNAVQAIVATSPNYAKTSRELRKHQSKVRIIPNGLDETHYSAPSDAVKQKWRNRFPRPYFLFVGVLRYYKGLHTLLEAAATTPADIVIAGDGPLDQQLRAQASDLSLTNVHFTGAIGEEDKCALLDGCSAFVFPSHLRSEAFGMSLVEAAMFARPMISCEIGTGTSFINRDGETGLVIAPETPSALSDAMRKIASETAAAETMGRNARKRYLSQFTGSKMCRNYARLYRELLV